MCFSGDLLAMKNNKKNNDYELIQLQSITKSLEHTCEVNSAFTQQKTDQLIKQFYEYLIHYTADINASDIHIEPKKSHSCIRIRVDSVLEHVLDFPKLAHEQLVSKIKILSNLDISQTKTPQDGKINIDNSNHSLQLRVSLCPTLYGEKVVLRILKSDPGVLSIDNLHMNVNTRSAFINSIESPQGLILITGPTGSGKTKTLYTALNHLNTQEKNIVTVEDPVEIQLNNINQTSVNIKSGLDFNTALRAFLRQDPDIIMIGEIRDAQTAKIALQAAHTGHLVFATLHTNSCLDVVDRLVQLGVDYYSLITSLKLILSQRLLRKIKKSNSISETTQTSDSNNYEGRVAIFEHLYFDKELIYNALRDKKYLSTEKISSYSSLREQANYFIKNNITDLKEVNRVLGTGADYEA